MRELIAQRFGVRLSLASIGVVLARQGLTPQKSWQRETYPALARHAKRTKAEISFWDESGVRAGAVHGTTWGARAHTEGAPEIRTVW